MLLLPLWCLVALAAWVLPDSTVHAATPWTRLGLMVACIGGILPDDYTRLRRGGQIYLLTLVIYELTHNLRWWTLGQ